MKWYHVVEQNARLSALANTVFEALEMRIMGDVWSIQDKQGKGSPNPTDSVIVHFSQPSIRLGDYGQKLWQLRSSIAEVTLYINGTIGWIEGRVDRKTLFGVRSKRFAICADGSSFESNQVVVTNLGCYSTSMPLRLDDAIAHFAESIVTDLALGAIENSDLSSSDQDQKAIPTSTLFSQETY